MAREKETRLAYSTGGEREVEPGKAAPVPSRGRLRIRLERRPSDRLVTLVTGFSESSRELEGLLRALKSACNTGGTSRLGVLELQGDQRAKVEAFLAGRGLRARIDPS